MTRLGVNIVEYLPKYVINAGINYKPAFPGMVSDYEEYKAMLWGHMNIIEWREADSKTREMCVAAYRVQRLIALAENDAQQRKAEQDAKK